MAKRDEARAAVLRELEGGATDDAPTPEPEANAAEAEDTPEPEADGDEVEDTDAEAGESDAEEAEDEDEDEEDAEDEDTDPGQAKRLEAIQKAHKRNQRQLDKQREQMLEEVTRAREQLDKDRQRFAPLIERVEKFAELEQRAATNPLGVLRALGFPNERMEELSKQSYYASKSASDPKYGELAAREQHRLEQSDEVSALRREIQELKDREVQREKAAQQQQQVSAYLDQVTSAVGDETPIVARMLEANREKTLDRFRSIAKELIDLTGEVPEPAEVAQALEEARRKDLEEAGVDLDSVIKRKKTKKKPAADESKTAKSQLSSDLGKPTKPRSTPRTQAEIRADVLRELENGAAD